LNLNWRWEDQEQAVLSVCSSLITIVNDNGSQVVQFSHFSVKEFLTSDRLASSGSDLSHYHIGLEPAHTVLAQSCLATLLRLGNHTEQINTSLPLAQYAAEYWVNHARFLDVSSRIQEGMQSLFDPDKIHFAAWVQVHDIDDDSFSYDSPRSPSKAVPLYYAALCGFHGLAKYLLAKYPDHIDVTDGRQGAALHAASFKNHPKVAQLLLENGGNVNVRDPDYWTPLHIASQYRHHTIGQLLLKHGADVNVKRDDKATPLHLATIGGHFETAKTLLEHKAMVNTRDGGGMAPLHRAAENGYVDVTRLLLSHRADVNARDKDGMTPLHLSCYRGKPNVIGLLLKDGASVDAKDNRGMTPLQMVTAGNSEIEQLLSDYIAKRKT
jgi:ankyrin repeat protein